MVKKVMIITYYKGWNYGAFLQAFSLLKAIESFGIHPVFLKHDATDNSKCYVGRTEEDTHFFKQFNDSLEECQKILPESSFLYDSPYERYDLALLGSDEIWNFNGRNVKHLDIFWGKGVNAKKIAAYAPSVGPIRQKSYLKRIKHLISIHNVWKIGARDDLTEAIGRMSFNREVVRVLDPTFLINFDLYKKRYDFKDFKPFDYILIYSYGLSEEQSNFIRSYSIIHKKIIVATGEPVSVADYNIPVDPFTWIDLIDNCSMMFTTTFHGTAFAISRKKNFYSMNDKSPKIESLLREFSLSERMLNTNPIFNNLNITNETINYDNLNSLIDLRVNKSIEFLKSCLS